MTFDLIFLPLLGGYLFFTHFNGTRYRASGFPAQRLIFPSAAFGLVFLLAAKFIEMMVISSHARHAMWEHHAVVLLIPSLGWSALTAAAGFSASKSLARDYEAIRLGTLESDAARERLRLLIPSRRLRSWLATAFERDGGDYFRPTHSVRGRAVAMSCVATIAIGLPWLFPNEPIRILTPLWYYLSCCLLVFGAAAVVHEKTRWPFWGLAYRISLVAFLLGCALAFVTGGIGSSIRDGWPTFSPVSNSGLPCLALVLALISVVLANFVLEPKAASAFRAISGRVSYLGSFLFWAFVQRQLIEITLKSGKVYIGQVKSLLPASETADGFIQFLPWNSGYRDSEHKMHITTSYTEQFSNLRAGSGALLSDDPLEVFYKILPIAEFAHCGQFDPDYYSQFLKRAAQSTSS